MAATTLFSSPISHHKYPIFIQQLSSSSSNYNNNNNNNLLLQPVTTRSPLILIRASSSPPTVDKQEKDDEQQGSISSDSFTQPISSIPLGGCKSCGKAEIERGCNGEGRIQGGIATVPGFGWWPIKAYRPCPGFVATGGRYRRQGQSMDEVAGFGTVPRASPATTATTSASTIATGETESSEKKQGPRKFKR